MKQRVLITGTTSGIGRGLMSYYYRQGWEIIAFNRRLDKQLESAFSAVHFIQIDVRDRDQIRDYFKQANERDELPELYYLNAGINKTDNFKYFSIEAFQEVMDINLTGTLNFIDAALPYLSNKKATFVATSSTSNIFPNPNNLGYYISKLSETKIFKMLESCYGKHGLRFKILILGPIATNISAGGSIASKFQAKVRDLITVSTDTAVPKIVHFVHSKKKVFYYPFFSVLLFRLAALAQKLVPNFYQGSVPSSSSEELVLKSH